MMGAVDQNVTALERAFQIAGSGNVASNANYGRKEMLAKIALRNAHRMSRSTNAASQRPSPAQDGFGSLSRVVGSRRAGL
jgi:hypothetical protein